jgi:hypothetical protein
MTDGKGESMDGNENRARFEKKREQRLDAARKRWDKAQGYLNTYIKDNIDRGWKVFKLTVAAMVVGWILIVVGITWAIIVGASLPPLTPVSGVPSDAAVEAGAAETETPDETGESEEVPQTSEGAGVEGSGGSNGTQAAADDTEQESEESRDEDGKDGETDTTTWIVALPQFLSVLAGILTNFIAGTFLVLHERIMKNAISYTAILERGNNAGIARDIASLISETDDKIEKEAYAAIARAVIGAGAPPEKEGEQTTPKDAPTEPPQAGDTDSGGDT